MTLEALRLAAADPEPLIQEHALWAIAQIEAIGRIRYTTSHPLEFSDALIEARNLSAESRRKMSFELKRQIQEFDASYWAQSVVANFKILEMV